jgi:hypothetical protein
MLVQQHSTECLRIKISSQNVISHALHLACQLGQKDHFTIFSEKQNPYHKQVSCFLLAQLAQLCSSLVEEGHQS